MKKILPLLLALCLLPPLCGCTKQTKPTAAAASSASSSSSSSPASVSSAPQPASSAPAASPNTPAPDPAAPAAPSAPAPKPTVSVTIPEGYSVPQIAARLEAKGVCSKADFISAVNSYSFTEASMQQIAYDPNTVCFRLEGFLYPDTYTFYVGMKAEDAIGTILRNTDSKIGSKYSYPGLSVYQLVTLASIIQREGKTADDMKDVSDVFHNRLNNSAQFPYLQSEATRDYLTSSFDVVSVSSALVDQYKAYYQTVTRRKGLPSGPICNPGAAALNAAAHPSGQGYLYFASDSSGVLYFAKTIAEQNANITKAGLKSKDPTT